MWGEALEPLLQKGNPTSLCDRSNAVSGIPIAVPSHFVYKYDGPAASADAREIWNLKRGDQPHKEINSSSIQGLLRHRHTSIPSQLPRATTHPLLPHSSSIFLGSSQCENFNPFVRANGRYNVERHWSLGYKLRSLWFKDGFHFLLSVRLPFLLPSMFLAHLVWAAFLALLLGIVTGFDEERCLGGLVAGNFNFYFFTVETMFAIGYGSPRFPSCDEANWMVSLIVISTVLFNGLVLGVIFAKFSSASRRRWAIFFSSSLVGVPVVHHGTTPRETCASTALRTDGKGENSMTAPPPDRSCNPKTIGSDIHEFDSFASIGDVGHAPDSPLGWGNSAARASRRENNFKINEEFTLSFRVMNLTSQSFFNTQLSLFLLIHGDQQIQISRISTFYTDVPLELMQLPTTVTICSSDLLSLEGLSTVELSSTKNRYELVALLTFTDNRTSRTIEIRKSWMLSEIRWNVWFADALRREPDGTYSVNVEVLDTTVKSRT